MRRRSSSWSTPWAMPCIMDRCSSRPSCSHSRRFIEIIIWRHSVRTCASRRHAPSCETFSRRLKDPASPAVTSITSRRASSVASSAFVLKGVLSASAEAENAIKNQATSRLPDIVLKVLFIEKLNLVQYLFDVLHPGSYLLSFPLDKRLRSYIASSCSRLYRRIGRTCWHL